MTHVVDAEGNIKTGAGGGGGVTDAEYLVLTLNADLSDERRLVDGDGLTGADGGAGGDYTLGVDATVVRTTGVQSIGGAKTFTDDLSMGAGKYFDGNFRLEDATELTISSGAITATKSWHTVDTEGDAASDDLDTINGGTTGDVLLLRAAHTDRTVMLTENGNIVLPEGYTSEYALPNTEKYCLLFFDGSNWHLLNTGMIYVDRGDPASHDWTQATLTADGSYYDLDLSSIVTDPDATLVHFIMYLQSTAANHEFIVRKNGNSNSINIDRLFTQVADILFQASVWCACDDARKIEYRMNANVYTCSLSVRGWFKPG